MNADTRLRRAGGRHRVEAKRILSHLLNGSWEAAALSPAQLLRAQAHMRVQTKNNTLSKFSRLQKDCLSPTWEPAAHSFFFLNPTPFPCWERSPGVHTALAALAVAGSEAT